MSEHNIDPEIPVVVRALAAGAHHHLLGRVLDDRVDRIHPQLADRERVVVPRRAVVHDDLRRPVVKRTPLAKRLTRARAGGSHFCCAVCQATAIIRLIE